MDFVLRSLANLHNTIRAEGRPRIGQRHDEPSSPTQCHEHDSLIMAKPIQLLTAWMGFLLGMCIWLKSIPDHHNTSRSRQIAAVACLRLVASIESGTNYILTQRKNRLELICSGRFCRLQEGNALREREGF